jgi:hypothetical protein
MSGPYQYRRRVMCARSGRRWRWDRPIGQSRGQSRPGRLLGTSARRSLSHSCEGQSRSSKACGAHSRRPIYGAVRTPIPAHLAALVEQLKIEPHLRPASIITAVVYSLLLVSALIAHAMGFPRFSTERRATPFVSINVPAPLASEDGAIGYR